MTEAEELELLELEEKEAHAKAAAPPELPHARIVPTEELANLGQTSGGQAVAQGVLQRFPFLRQAEAAVRAGANQLKGSHMSATEDYRQALTELERQNAQSDREHGFLHGVGSVVGTGASLGAFAPMGLGTGALAAQGALQGLSDSPADLTKGQVGQAALDTAKSAALSAALGKLAEAGASKASPLLARAGEALRNKAGFLKVNSLHPVPTLGEQMADLPGGTEAVGRALLDRGIGKLSKAGTAAQLKAASEAANADIGKLASDYDARGGGLVDVRGAIEKGLERSAELAGRPVTKGAGNEAAAMLNEYRNLYQEPVSAAEALRLKRELGEEIYGKGAMFQRSQDKALSDYASALRDAQAGVGSSLDAALGPEFAARNLLSRQMGAAAKAADRSAARTQTNHLAQSLVPTMLAASGFAGGHAAGHLGAGGLTGLALGAGSLLASKYGAQAGASALNTAGKALGAAAASPGVVGSAAPALERALLESRLLREAQLRPPALAQDKEDEKQRMLATILRTGAP